MRLGVFVHVKGLGGVEHNSGIGTGGRDAKGSSAPFVIRAREGIGMGGGDLMGRNCLICEIEWVAGKAKRAWVTAAQMEAVVGRGEADVSSAKLSKVLTVS